MTTHYELTIHTRGSPRVKDVYIEDYLTRDGAERAGRAMLARMGFAPVSPWSNHYINDEGTECEVVVIYRGDRPE